MMTMQVTRAEVYADGANEFFVAMMEENDVLRMEHNYEYMGAVTVDEPLSPEEFREWLVHDAEIDEFPQSLSVDDIDRIRKEVNG